MGKSQVWTLGVDLPPNFNESAQQPDSSMEISDRHLRVGMALTQPSHLCLQTLESPLSENGVTNPPGGSGHTSNKLLLTISLVTVLLFILSAATNFISNRHNFTLGSLQWPICSWPQYSFLYLTSLIFPIKWEFINHIFSTKPCNIPAQQFMDVQLCMPAGPAHGSKHPIQAPRACSCLSITSCAVTHLIWAEDNSWAGQQETEEGTWDSRVKVQTLFLLLSGVMWTSHLVSEPQGHGNNITYITGLCGINKISYVIAS